MTYTVRRKKKKKKKKKEKKKKRKKKKEKKEKKTAIRAWQFVVGKRIKDVTKTAIVQTKQPEVAFPWLNQNRREKKNNSKFNDFLIRCSTLFRNEVALNDSEEHYYPDVALAHVKPFNIALLSG